MPIWIWFLLGTKFWFPVRPPTWRTDIAEHLKHRNITHKISNLYICVSALVKKTRWWPRSEWRQLFDGKSNRHAHMSDCFFLIAFSFNLFSLNWKVGWHSGCCLLVIFPLSILLLGTLGWLSAPNEFRLLPVSLFPPLSACGLLSPLQPPLTLTAFLWVMK